MTKQDRLVYPQDDSVLGPACGLRFVSICLGGAKVGGNNPLTLSHRRGEHRGRPIAGDRPVSRVIFVPAPTEVLLVAEIVSPVILIACSKVLLISLASGNDFEHVLPQMNKRYRIYGIGH